MGKKPAFQAIFIFSLFFLLSGPALLNAQGADDTQVKLHVYNCNENAICEPQFGENYPGCPLDCEAPASTSTPPEPSSGYGINSALSGSLGYHSAGEIIPSTIQVEVTAHSAFISWQTYGLSLGLLSWGKTVDGELGTISEINYTSNHQIELDNLNSATHYFFKIETRDKNNISNFLGAVGFTTLPEKTFPENPADFSYTLEDNGILLTWQNPTDPNFQTVRLLRSRTFYPTDPNGGQVLYEGEGISFLDVSVVTGGDYYYTLFAQNTDGQFSSGVILHLRLKSNIPRVVPTNIFSSEKTGGISINNINIAQNQSSLAIGVGNNVNVVPNQPIDFSIFNDSFSKTLNSFVLSVEDQDKPGLFHSYLFHFDSDSDILSVRIPAFTELGSFRFMIDIINGSNTIGHLAGTLSVQNHLEPSTPWGQRITAYLIAFFQWLLPLFGFF